MTPEGYAQELVQLLWPSAYNDAAHNPDADETLAIMAEAFRQAIAAERERCCSLAVYEAARWKAQYDERADDGESASLMLGRYEASEKIAFLVRQLSETPS